MKKNIYSGVLFCLLLSFTAIGQSFGPKDSLRGAITKERAWWDLRHYELEVEVDPKRKYLNGTNAIRYEVLEPGSVMQLDLREPMKLESVVQDGRVLDFEKEGNAYFVRLPEEQVPGEIRTLQVEFKGRPVESINPPWDGGFIWAKDEMKNDFVANAVQLTGPSTWFPCKDHPYDEPDEGLDLRIIAPSELVAVGNGRLIGLKPYSKSKNIAHWRVTQPINAYGINLSLGKYAHFKEIYPGEKGELSCEYYVLEYNLYKAREQFRQVPMMLQALEHWFGPYPFYEDGYKLVEVPYLGMEHQSSVTYGNGYENGYLGRDLSSTGWGHKFDFIIIHESAHEWFANSITNKDVADMWIHEGFTNYSEVLYLDYHFGKKAGDEYLQGIRELIRNDRPIIGDYGVGSEGSSDMYPKGASIVHMIRQMVDDDEAFRKLLRGLNEEFYHQTVSSEEVEKYIARETGLDLKPFFDQYLRTTKIPRLQYRLKGKTVSFRLRDVIKGFHMPLRVFLNGEAQWIEPSENWQEITNGFVIDSLRIDPNFYVGQMK